MPPARLCRGSNDPRFPWTTSAATGADPWGCSSGHPGPPVPEPLPLLLQDLEERLGNGFRSASATHSSPALHRSRSPHLA
jgi:hypothetical protein